MAIKSKISYSKRNNQKRTKLIKQGIIRKSKKPKQKNEIFANNIVTKSSQDTDEESCHGSDMLEMVDQHDMKFLKESITNQSYNFYNKIKYLEVTEPKLKKQKITEDEVLENKYWSKVDKDANNIQFKSLLPIKTKKGIIQQQIVQTNEKGIDCLEQTTTEPTKGRAENIKFDLEDDLKFDPSNPISATQLLIGRQEALRRKKIEIGSLCAGLLENPEERIINLRFLLIMMEDEKQEAYSTIRKLVMISLTEVFKDILPSYEIKSINKEGVKLKKDTLKLQKYEETLLEYYKKFLKKLEMYIYTLIKKKGGDPHKQTQDEIKMAILGVQSMCELLIRHPYFNFSANLAQALIPILNSWNKDVRNIVKTSIITVFKEDKKEEITLKILRNINNYIKTHLHQLHGDILEVLLALNLRNVNLDLEKEQGLKEKKILMHKSRVLQMSKKERKRKKHLIELEKELLETKAEENKQAKQKTITEITKILFNVYFRILKSPSSKKVLGLCLQGLGKYAHCINLEYFVDLVNVLDNLLKDEALNYDDKLQCVQTIFVILGGQGEALNIDPTRFYNILYKDLLSIDATMKETDRIKNLISTLIDALIKRRRKITNKRTIGFIKRLATLSLQLTHDSGLSCLGLIKHVLQLNKNVDILLDFDSSIGEGQYHTEVIDPEYSNASSTAMYELVELTRHYHPVMRLFASNICCGVPVIGDRCLPALYSKMTIQDLLINFNMSEMSFNPPVTVPKQTKAKPRSHPHNFADVSFKNDCRGILKQCKSSIFCTDNM